MTYKIYQAYYKPDQIQFLDSKFEPYDNSNSQLHQYREYPIFLDIQQKASHLNLDKWGYFSWKYQQKLPGLTGDIICKQIENNPDYDVYFWNPFSNYAVTAYNVWEQGQYFHPHLIDIMEHIFPIMGLDVNLLYQPMLPKVIYFGLYCVGNRKFWDGFLDLASKYEHSIEHLPDSIAKLHNGPAGYEPFPDLGYFPFIHERLLSTYLHLNRNTLRIWSHHHNFQQYGDVWHLLYSVKLHAISTGDINLWHYYFRLRRQVGCNIHYAENWLNKIDNNI